MTTYGPERPTAEDIRRLTSERDAAWDQYREGEAGDAAYGRYWQAAANARDAHDVMTQPARDAAAAEYDRAIAVASANPSDQAAMTRYERAAELYESAGLADREAGQ